MPAPPLPPAPYPGLRAFRPEETAIFCGRGEHRADVLDLLREARFLAVVGASGSGKSSLVLAGALPDIRDGQLIGVPAGAARVVSAQPGLRPFANLAAALAGALPRPAAAAGTEAARCIEDFLRRGPLGLVQALDAVGNDPGRALVIVVDQFEEIFRFSDLGTTRLAAEERAESARILLDGTDNEAQAFVSLLLESAEQSRHLVYVLLTMRSEFLARCDQFSGLPEAVSRSQFLTPRLDRQQLEQAIVRPLDLFGASIATPLVRLILNQVSTGPDQLPLMQHALARTWERRVVAGGPRRLETQDYLDAGGLAEALDWHADAVCAELKKGRSIGEASVARFFRALAHHPGADVAPVRRPARIRQIAAETGLGVAEACAIADAFRAEGCHLLMPPRIKAPVLAEDTLLDISHESLLRQWKRLKGWLDAEWRQRRLAEELSRAMEEWRRRPRRRGGAWERRFRRWKIAGESVATRLYHEAEPIFFGRDASPALPAWGRRYGIRWSRLRTFAGAAFRWKKTTALMSRMGAGFTILTALLVPAVVWALVERSKAREQAQIAKAAGEEAKKSAAAALVRMTEAVDERARAQADASAQSGAFRKLAERFPSALADVPELRGFLPAAEPTPVGPTAPVAAPSTLAAPVAWEVSPVRRLPAKPAVELFRDATTGKLRLLSGDKGLRSTSSWTLAGATLDPDLLPFEATWLIRAADAGIVAAFAGDGQVHAVTGAGKSVSSGRSAEAITAAQPVTLGGRPFVLVGTGAGNVGLWDLTPGVPPAIFPTGRSGIVNAVDFHAGTSAVLASGDAGWAGVFSLEAGGTPGGKITMPGKVIAFRAPVSGASFHPGGQVVLIPTGSRALVWPVGGKAPARGLLHDALVRFATFSPDGALIATADIGGRVCLWSFPGPSDQAVQQTGSGPSEPVVLTGHRGAVTALEWSPGGEYLVSGGADGLAIVWQRARSRQDGSFQGLPYLLPRHEGGVSSLSVSPDGRLVATAGADRRARVNPLRPESRGRFRVWPGKDTAGGGDLALLSENDAGSDEFGRYFLAEAPAGAPPGLVGRLDPAQRFINARWEYNFTPRSLLRTTKVLVRKVGPDGEPTGPAVEAQPVDWGPPAATGYDFDLSPGVQKALGLAEGEVIQMEIPLVPIGQEKSGFAAPAAR